MLVKLVWAAIQSVWICAAHIDFKGIKGNNMQSVCVACIEILVRQ